MINPLLAEHMIQFAGRRAQTMLDIGVNEGEVGAWFLDKVLTNADDRYIGIGTWSMKPAILPMEYADESEVAASEVLARRALTRFGTKSSLLSSHREVSFVTDPFDIVHWDSDRRLQQCLSDSCLMWDRLSTDDGILAWSGYRTKGRNALPPVYPAVDAFLSLVEGQYEDVCNGNIKIIKRVR